MVNSCSNVKGDLLLNFDGHDLEVRMSANGDPLFRASHVARILDIGRTQEVIRCLDDDEVTGCIVDTLSRGEREVPFVTEAGLYSLVLRSRKPEAKPFKRWLTHDVLPQIRRTGGYSTHKEPQPAYMLPPDYASALRALADEVEAKSVLEARVAELEPQAEAWSTFIDRADMYEFGTAAKLLSMDPNIDIGRQRLFDWMGARGDLYRDRDARGREFWVPSQRRIDAGHLALKFGATYEVKGERVPASPKVVIPGDAMMYWWRQVKAEGRFDKRRGLRVVDGTHPGTEQPSSDLPAAPGWEGRR